MDAGLPDTHGISATCACRAKMVKCFRTSEYVEMNSEN